LGWEYSEKRIILDLESFKRRRATDMEKSLGKKGNKIIQTSSRSTIIVLGGTRHVGMVYIEEFLSAGFNVRILARSPECMKRSFPEADIVHGSMMQDTDVARAMKVAAAAV
jgi:short-subunit dehydrogenase involved in D-alanine esterification of teichoic acids